ncbi:MAG: hypothetical protein PHO89_11425, partial [Methylacidiphilaceae bacterium]|nr:hypothetical protein [Candidatus Methylacidiphilaceae bacterium]
PHDHHCRRHIEPVRHDTQVEIRDALDRGREQGDEPAQDQPLPPAAFGSRQSPPARKEEGEKESERQTKANGSRIAEELHIVALNMGDRVVAGKYPPHQVECRLERPHVAL